MAWRAVKYDVNFFHGLPRLKGCHSRRAGAGWGRWSRPERQWWASFRKHYGHAVLVKRAIGWGAFLGGHVGAKSVAHEHLACLGRMPAHPVALVFTVTKRAVFLRFSDYDFPHCSSPFEIQAPVGSRPQASLLLSGYRVALSGLVRGMQTAAGIGHSLAPDWLLQRRLHYRIASPGWRPCRSYG